MFRSASATRPPFRPGRTSRYGAGLRSRRAWTSYPPDLFGAAYVPEMAPTPLLRQLERIKGEMERGEESLERKLRYLLWLN